MWIQNQNQTSAKFWHSNCSFYFFLRNQTQMFYVFKGWAVQTVLETNLYLSVHPEGTWGTKATVESTRYWIFLWNGSISSSFSFCTGFEHWIDSRTQCKKLLQLLLKNLILLWLSGILRLSLKAVTHVQSFVIYWRIRLPVLFNFAQVKLCTMSFLSNPWIFIVQWITSP